MIINALTTDIDTNSSMKFIGRSKLVSSTTSTQPTGNISAKSLIGHSSELVAGVVKLNLTDRVNKIPENIDGFN
jgi:hypothetical protein